MQIHYLFGTDPPCSKLLETSFGECSQPSCVTLCASVCPLLLLQVIHAGCVLNTCNITAWHEIVVVFEGGIANLRPQEYTLCQGGCEPNMGWIIATRLGESCSEPRNFQSRLAFRPHALSQEFGKGRTIQGQTSLPASLAWETASA